MSGYVLDGLHTGHWQAVVVPLRSILVDWHVVLVEWFKSECGIVSKRVGLDQSPGCIWLGTKVAVDQEWIIILVQNFVDSTDVFFLCYHNVFTWSDWELTSVSREAWKTCAIESSFSRIAHITVCAAILTGGGLTAMALTAWIKACLLRKSLKENQFII